jgi:hypothetical protein
MHQAQVRHQHAVAAFLVEERPVVEHVERYPVGQLDLLELRLFGEDLVDVCVQQRVG